MENGRSGRTYGSAEGTVDNKVSSIDQLKEIIDVDGEKSPVKVVRLGDVFFVAIGNYRLSETFRSKEEAIRDGKRKDVSRLLQLMEVMYKIIKSEEHGK